MRVPFGVRTTLFQERWASRGSDGAGRARRTGEPEGLVAFQVAATPSRWADTAGAGSRESFGAGVWLQTGMTASCTNTGRHQEEIRCRDMVERNADSSRGQLPYRAIGRSNWLAAGKYRAAQARQGKGNITDLLLADDYFQSGFLFPISVSSAFSARSKSSVPS